MVCIVFFIFFFFQAEDGIRDGTVTGVQTCALPISVLAVAVVGDDDGPIGKRHEVQGQRADRDDTPGRTDPPAGGKQRGPVRQRARDETRGEERGAGDGWEREQGALEHGPEYGRSRERWHPLSLRRDDRADLSSDPAYPLGP